MNEDLIPGFGNNLYAKKMERTRAEQTADEIMGLYRQHGGNEYAGERVTQLEHMAQAAVLAESQGFEEEVVLAAFLHDIGHICVSAMGDNEMEGFGIRDHEEVGATFLRDKGFSSRLIRLVESHVDAKRYLTWKHPEYYNQLSEASKKTLEYQGGRMPKEEALIFEEQPLFDLIIQMRRWDEEAKVEELQTGDIEKYRAMIIHHLEEQPKKTGGHFQLVVCDIAGTTVEDKGDVAAAFLSAFHQFGIAMDPTEVDKVMGYRKKDAIYRLLNKFFPEKLQEDPSIGGKIHDAFISEMIIFYSNDTALRPMPYAVSLFSELKQHGIKVALNTGFTRAITQTILDRLQWRQGHHFDKVISSDEVTNGRPSDDMINSLMKELGVADPSTVVKVGDTEVDIEEGKNAGCGMVVAVTTGALSRSQLEAFKPDHIIDSLNELPKLILL